MASHYRNHSATCFFTQHCIHFNCSIEFHCMNIPQCIHSPTDGHLGCFRFFTFTHMLQRRLAHIFTGTRERFGGTSLAVDGRVSTSSPCQIFSNVTVPIYTFSSRVGKFPLFHILSNTWYYEDFIFANLMGMKEKLTVFNLHVNVKMVISS